MKRYLLISLLICFFMSGIALSEECSECDYKPGELLVRFDESEGPVSTSMKQSILNSRVPGSEVKKQYEMVSGLCLVLLPDGWIVENAQQAFSDVSGILYAEPNYKRGLSILPNDTQFNQLWGMHNTGQTDGTVDADIDAPEGWNIETGGSDIVVAVADTGVYYNHPDLSANMWVNQLEFGGSSGIDDDGNGYVDDIYGYDFAGTAGTPDSDPCDTYGHGTHVSGTIGAVGNNGLGVAGVCWDTSIMALKVSPDNSPSIFVTATVEAIQYAINNGADVINASFGGTFYSQAEYDAIQAAGGAGVLFVAAAGNSATDNDIIPQYPASYNLDNIISVLATDDDDVKSSFSCYGVTSVDIGAPGSSILSCQNYGGYVSMNGTSMASPHVAGASALFWSLKPGLSYSQIKNSIMSSADSLSSLSGLCVTGGRLNVANGLAMINSEVLNKDTMTIYNSIQGAIDAAANGDELIADANNWYFESIDFKGKDILLRSGDIDNPGDPTISSRNTYISGVISTDSVVTFESGETSAAELKGFTITGGQSSEWGGGINIYLSSPTITDCIIKNNKSSLDGGGISIMGPASPDINDCEITGNNATFFGGGIYCDWADPVITNCLIAENVTENWAGAGICLRDSSADILNCTISSNRILYEQGFYGGGIYFDGGAQSVIKDCIFSDNEDYAIYENVQTSPSVSYCLFYNNPDGDYDDYDYGVLTGKTELESLSGVSDIVEGPPLFAEGRLGGYYLSQIVAGQASDSAAVDEGSAPASVVDLNEPYSTRTDIVEDTGIVDLGYHYKDAQPASSYTLTIQIPTGNGTTSPSSGTHIYTQYKRVKITAAPDIGDPNNPDDDYQLKSWSGTDDDSVEGLINYVTMNSDKTVTVEFETKNVELRTYVVGGGGDIAQNSDEDRYIWDYPRGTVVNLTADPCDRSERVEWTGTDDDTSHSVENTVTMTDRKIVSVEFVPVRVLHVGQDPEYPNLQSAINAAEDGDTVLVDEGRWPSDDARFVISNKAITLTSTDPNNAEIVSNTILDTGVAVYNCGRDTIINGFTFDGTGYINPDGFSGDEYDFTDDGGNGSNAAGGGLRLHMYPSYPLPATQSSSPTVKNCVFDGCFVVGGNGGDGAGDSGDGGWGGWAHGGAVSIGPESNPKFVNCEFIDCLVAGGNGGNGSSGDQISGRGGQYDQSFLGSGGWYWGPYDDFYRYSGYGGAVYIDVNSTPEFENCLFAGSTSIGGCSGIAGDVLYAEPDFHWKTARFGGAVYVSANSKPIFTECVFEDNFVDVNEPDAEEPYTEQHGEPTFQDNPYMAYGGSIAIDTGAEPEFIDCEIIGSSSHVGGGMYLYNALAKVDGCSFLENTSIFGGGLLFVGGTPRIARSEFAGNVAELYYEPDDPVYDGVDFYGDGGAVGCYAANGMISDCQIQSNNSSGSGGGVYISSQDFTGEEAPGDNSILLKNCLITDNTSVIDGGGVSAQWHSEPNLISCTIAYNDATGDGFDTGYGGGVSSAYNNYTQIRDSIIWGNTAGTGPQIAVRSSQPGDPQPSEVKVRYSDVADGAAGVYVDTGDPETSADDCLLDWDYVSNLDGTVESNPLFVRGPLGGKYYLSQPGSHPSEPNSPCVNKGSGDAHLRDMYRHTTRTSGKIKGWIDDGRLDIGYHYILDANLVADFDYNDVVNIVDSGRFFMHWLDSGCEFPDWCHGKDLNKDGIVNGLDWSMFAQAYPNWEDNQPPYPDPLTWEIQPEPNSTSSEDDFYMVATEAFDNACGSDVEYYFQRHYKGGAIVDVGSGWQSSRSWSDTGFDPEYVYGYRVKVRDCNTPNGNETDWSVIAYTQIDGDGVPLAPSDLTAMFVSTTEIELNWSDNSNNEDGFAIERSIEGGVFQEIDTAGAGVTTYTDTGVASGTEYTYRIYAYNLLGNSGYSNEVTITGEEDTEAPDADSSTGGYQTNAQWATVPQETTDANGIVHTMTAQTADDTGYGDNNPCEYYFEWIGGQGSWPDSGWQSSSTFTYFVGTSGLQEGWRVKARDAVGNETGWSTIGYINTQ